MPEGDLTTEDVRRVLRVPLPTAKRYVATWARRGWPVVRRRACQGNARGEYIVDRASFDRWCEGDAGPLAVREDSAA